MSRQRWAAAPCSICGLMSPAQHVACQAALYQPAELTLTPLVSGPQRLTSLLCLTGMWHVIGMLFIPSAALYTVLRHAGVARRQAGRCRVLLPMLLSSMVPFCGRAEQHTPVPYPL